MEAPKNEHAGDEKQTSPHCSTAEEITEVKTLLLSTKIQEGKPEEEDIVSPTKNTDRDPASWQPGAFKQFPTLTLLVCLGILLCLAASVIVLVHSDGKLQSQWPLPASYRYGQIQPSTLLAIFIAFANAGIVFIKSDGATRAWWTRSLQCHTTLDQLHHFWAHGVSLFASITAGPAFSWIALSTIATVLIALANSPLLQAATTTDKQYVLSSNVSILANVSADPLPLGATGYRIWTPQATTNEYVLTPWFRDIVNSYRGQNPIPLHFTGCSGSCTADFAAPGFDINCTETAGVVHYDYQGVAANTNVGLVPLYSTILFNGTSDGGTGTFFLNYTTGGDTYDNVTYCSAKQVTHTCVFRAAIVNYTLLMDNFTQTIRLPLVTPDTYKTNRTIRLIDTPIDRPNGANFYDSALGGIFQAVFYQYQSRVTFDASPQAGYGVVDLGGLPAGVYLTAYQRNPGACNFAWSNFLPDVVRTFQEFSLRSAIVYYDPHKPPQLGYATQYSIESVYASHYLYLGLALGISLLAFVFLIPLFAGYWRLGRTVSFSPLEVAKAFQAPLLSGQASNATADRLLLGVKGTRVQYGVGAEDFSSSNLRMGDPIDTRPPMAEAR